MEAQQASEYCMADVKEIVRNARRLQLEIDKLGMGTSFLMGITPKPEDFVELYDILVKSKAIRDATRKLFVDRHYARAVEEAYKCLDNVVRDKSGLSTSGKDLMDKVFSGKNPILKLNALKTSSQKDEQVGYMIIFGGCIVGIRNPRAHDHKKVDSPEIALEMLVWANHLMRLVEKAKHVRKPKKVSTP